LFYTMLCVVFGATKAVVSKEMMTGDLKLHPVSLLSQVAPYALVQCMFASLCTGEIKSIASRWSSEFDPFVNPYPLSVVLISGLLSFSLNICSLQANKLTGPLTLCIAGNVKQALLICLSTALFGVQISPLNGYGIIVTLTASANYSYLTLLGSTVESARSTSTANETGGGKRLEYGGGGGDEETAILLARKHIQSQDASESSTDEESESDDDEFSRHQKGKCQRNMGTNNNISARSSTGDYYESEASHRLRSPPKRSLSNRSGSSPTPKSNNNRTSMGLSSC